MERKFKIVKLEVLDGKVILGLKPLEIRPEKVIEEKITSSTEERIALRIARAFTETLISRQLMPQPPRREIINLTLSEDEYKDIGSPQIFQTVILEFKITIAP